MRSPRRSATMLLLFAVLACPCPAHATAGFAERHSDMVYNDLAVVHWIHPGDGCDCGNSCFQLVRKDNRFGHFEGLECSLAQLSVPESPRQTVVLAQCCADGTWLVYDLARQLTLVRTADRAEALRQWTSLGLRAPRLADARHGAHGLHSTWASRFEEWAFLLVMWMPLLLLIGLVAGMVRFVIELRRYLATRRVIHLMWCVVLLLPALSVVWFVVRVLFGAGRLAGR